jgi:hypothetical protein
MNIFTVLKVKEECFKVNYAWTPCRLEPRGVPPDQSGATTSLWSEVTFNRINFKYFMDLKRFRLWRRYRRQFWGHFFWGHISLKNGTFCSLSSHDSSSFKNMSPLI